MKKWFRFGLCLGVLTVALTCSALAAGGVNIDGYTTANENCTVTYADGKYTASYAGAQNGKQYALLVVKLNPDATSESDYSVSEDTIMYIDQKAAGSSGVTFENWIPMSTPDCVVLLGGVFDGVESPVVLGTLTGHGVTVSGSVSVSNAAKDMTVELYQQGTTTNPVYTVTIPAASSGGSADRNFSLDGVAEDTYDLKVTQEGHTAYWLTGVPVGSAPLTLPETLTLPCGDVNGDNRVNANDLVLLTSANNYNKSSTAASEPNTDLNGDGRINANDLVILTSSLNYNKGEQRIPYSE